MSFLLPLGLLLAGLALLPIVAHALFRGPARPLVFPAAHLVPLAAASAKKRNRVEDRALLALRVLLLLALALLAASPLVRCSRLSLHRPDGGSLAVALVIDDSASMNVVDGEKSRLERSLAAARDLVQAARPGDVFSVVLAGKPARIVSPATSDLASVSDALDQLVLSDRGTDLAHAIALGESSLQKLPQPSKQVVILSDFATEEPLFREQNAPPAVQRSAPLDELRRPFANCALSSGQLRGKVALIEVSCTKGSPVANRVVSVHAVTREPVQGRQVEVGPPLAEIGATEGLLRIALKDVEPTAHLVARLSPAPTHDQLPRDDQTELLGERDLISIGVRADAESAGTETGTSTVIELGLNALDPGVRVQPLAVLPDSAADLGRLAALIIDDPSGFTAEAQRALAEWLEQGGVALLLLGPRSQRTQLGAGFWPFLQEPPRLEPTQSPGARPGAGSSWGEAWDTWTDLDAARRVAFRADNAQLLVPWTDGAPLVVQRTHGPGSSLIASLPASVDESDFALRPAFLALLDRVIRESRLRRGSAASLVGESWTVPPATEVIGPSGAVILSANAEGVRTAEPALEGRYVFHSSKRGDGSALGEQIRYATRDPAESLRQPQAAPSQALSKGMTERDAPLPISREVALLALVLGAVELLFRALRRPNAAQEASGSPVTDASTIPAP